MKYRSFQDVKLSETGLGTWQLGSADWGNIDENKAFEILNAFAACGGNFIDTADVYGMGVSEKTIGKFLKSAPDRNFYVATKLGRRHDAENGWPQNFSYETMKKHVQDSLSHLRQEQLFLTQLHCIPTEQIRSGRVFDHLRKLQQDGLVRYWGASVETSEEALLCLDQDGIASLQIIFNLFRQHVSDEIFEKAAEKNVAIIARVPLASGLLSGKFNEQTRFSANDHRNYNANGEQFNVGETFSGIEYKQGIELAGRIKGLLPEGDMSQNALRWILDHPQVTTVIPGASSAEQVIRNCRVSDLPELGEQVHQDLRELYDHSIREFIRGVY